MERSQSFTSFDAARSSHNNSHNNPNINYNLNKIKNNFNNKYASTSSLNLRKALELRQTQLQLQQQQQQELLQRQQWQLLFEQRQQQLQQQQQQLLQQHQLQLATSSDDIDSPLYLSTLNNLHLLQVQRHKMLQCQKPTTTADNLEFTRHEDDTNEDDDEDYDGSKLFEAHLYDITSDNENFDAICAEGDSKNVNTATNDNELTLTAANSSIVGPLQQKLLRFQRQRPHSEAAITYRASSPITAAETAMPSTSAITGIPPLERRRLLQYDQSMSFDSALGSVTHSGDSNTTTPSTANSMQPGNMSPLSPRHTHFGKLKRDNSLHSDSSRYSSVDSLLEARKPDPEAILINLGFGPVVSEDILSRIPKRFLKPSQVRGIDTEAFVRRLQLANSLADHSVLGYRGLIGNPDLPPSTIVAKIMERFEVNERKKSMGSIEQTIR